MLLIMLRDGEKKAFQLARHPRKTLFIKNDGGMFRIASQNGAITGIAGKNLPEKIREPVPYEDRETYRVTIVPERAQLQIFTPESYLKSCVYVDAMGDGFRLIGGGNIIKEIVGENLRSTIEPDDLLDG